MDTATFPFFVGEKCTAVKSEPMVDADTHSRPTSKQVVKDIDTGDKQESSSSTPPATDRSSTPPPAKSNTAVSITASSSKNITNFSTKISNAKPLTFSSSRNKTQELLLASIQVGSIISVYWPENQVYYNANVTAKNC